MLTLIHRCVSKCARSNDLRLDWHFLAFSLLKCHLLSLSHASLKQRLYRLFFSDSHLSLLSALQTLVNLGDLSTYPTGLAIFLCIINDTGDQCVISLLFDAQL